MINIALPSLCSPLWNRSLAVALLLIPWIVSEISCRAIRKITKDRTAYQAVAPPKNFKGASEERQEDPEHK